jgi:hypothetical protein
MAISSVLYSSRSEEWPTPEFFFRSLHREFGFTLDPCATPANAKCRRFFTKRQNGLTGGRIRELKASQPFICE